MSAPKSRARVVPIRSWTANTESANKFENLHA